MKDIILDTLLDSVKLLPFLFITFLIMEYIEHKFSKKSKEKISKAIRGQKKSAESIEKNRLSHIGKEPWNKGKAI